MSKDELKEYIDTLHEELLSRVDDLTREKTDLLARYICLCSMLSSMANCYNEQAIKYELAKFSMAFNNVFYEADNEQQVLFKLIEIVKKPNFINVYYSEALYIETLFDLFDNLFENRTIYFAEYQSYIRHVASGMVASPKDIYISSFNKEEADSYFDKLSKRVDNNLRK